MASSRSVSSTDHSAKYHAARVAERPVVGREARDRREHQPGQRRLPGDRRAVAPLEVCRDAGLDVGVTVGGGQVGVARAPELGVAAEAGAQARHAEQDGEAGGDGRQGRQQCGREQPGELVRGGIPATGAPDDLGGRPHDRVVDLLGHRGSLPVGS